MTLNQEILPSMELENFKDFFQGKKIIVTGASGYIGTRLCEILSGFDCEITGISRRPARVSKAGPGRFKFLYADFSSPRSLWTEKLKAADLVFHLAAQTSLEAARENPGNDYRINVAALIDLISFLKKNAPEAVVIHAGTVTQIGLSETLPVDENHPDRPVTVYDFHKKLAEDYLKFCTRHGWIKALTLRLPNIYGPGVRESSSERGILNRIIQNAKQGIPLTLYGNGAPVRDFLHIEDAVRAFLQAAIHAECLSGGHYVLGTGAGISLREAFETIRREAVSGLGKVIEIKTIPQNGPMSGIEQRNFVANPEKFSKITGWKPRFTFYEGVHRFFQEIT